MENMTRTWRIHCFFFPHVFRPRELKKTPVWLVGLETSQGEPYVPSSNPMDYQFPHEKCHDLGNWSP